LPKEQILEYEGKVLELLPQASFKILLDNGAEVKAVISGRLRKNRIRILTGDRVRVAISPYDLSRGRVTFRL
jgi:translation initiation factor IF-1|tara:strand:- start:22 stop:237 length:216 start_codon:yes stop_codon:yes gene_type:complete